MTPLVLSVSGLTVVKQTGQCLLDNVNFCADLRPPLALLGRSGAGKTILSRAISDVLPSTLSVSRGSARIEQGGKEGAVNLLRITMVPQVAANALPPTLSPLGFLARVAVRSRGISVGQAVFESAQELERVGFPSNRKFLRKPNFQLSGGMAKRVAIAAALMTKPAVIVLDEPTSGLDPLSRKSIGQVLKALSVNVGIVLATHDILFARQVCRTFAILRGGCLVTFGVAEDLENSDDEYVRTFVDPKLSHFDVRT